MDTLTTAASNLATALTGDLLWVIAAIAVLTAIAFFFDAPLATQETK